MRRTPPTIAAVRILPHDPSLCTIEVRGQVIGPIRRDDAERLRLSEGAAWTSARARSVERLVAAVALRRSALASLGRSAMSREQLARRLEQRGAEPTLVASVLTELAADGWIDDRRAAESRASSIRRRGAMARKALDATLEAEGFGERDRRGAIDGDPTSDLDAARAEAKRSAARGESALAAARRLARRGFDADIIRAALGRRARMLEREFE